MLLISINEFVKDVTPIFMGKVALFAVVLWCFFWLVSVFVIIIQRLNILKRSSALKAVEPIMAHIVQSVFLNEPLSDKNILSKLYNGNYFSNLHKYYAIQYYLKSYYSLLSKEYWIKVVAIFKLNKFNYLSINKLREKGLSTKIVSSIMESLTIMNELVPEDLANKYLLSTKPRIVVAIRENLIKVGGLSKFDLIFSQIRTLNKLDAIILFESLKGIKTNGEFKFHHYLKSSNDINLNFLLCDLIVQHSEYEAKDILLQLYAVDNLLLREKIVNTLGKLMIWDAEELLIINFHNEPFSLQLEITKALGRLSSKTAANFLITLFEDLNNSIDLRIHAYRSLHSLRKLVPELIEKLEKQTTGESLQIINFIKNPLIKYI